MTVEQALVLGLIQGLTEFLPISSSGHLVLVQQLFGLTKDIFLFDIVLHMATLLAIIAYFGKSLLQVTFKEWLFVLTATIPAIVVGLLFQDKVEVIFLVNAWVGIELIATGLINIYTGKKLAATAQAASPLGEQLTTKNSFFIGVAQAISILPGVSRSGATVGAAIFSGLDREAAFRFSFLLAIPALVGAGILQLRSVMNEGWPEIDLTLMIVGFLAALIAGFLSLSLFKYVIMKAKLEWFGWYAIILGVVATFIFRPF